jgi:hypothetical protein
MKNALALALCGLLIGCGGGGTAVDTSSTSTCDPRVVTVALIGDSTQYGIDGTADLTTMNWWDPRAQVPHNPGAELQAMMDKTFGEGWVVVTNYAVPGSYAEMAPKVTADIIAENYGINDMNGGFPLKVYADDIKATGATIVETQFPTVYEDPREMGYVNTVKGLGLPVADVYSYIRSLPNWQSYYPNANSAHVTDALYKSITDNVLAPVVAAQVSALRCQTK